MPYADEICGIYKIVNLINGYCYVGQSQRVKKRVHEHFRLLKLKKHCNPRLQNAFNKYGRDAFTWSLEAVCEDPADLDVIEEAFISGEARFVEPVFYNIADFARAPMRGKKHSESTKEKIRASKRASGFDYKSETFRKSLSEGQIRRYFSNPEYVAKVRYIVDNPDMTYAARGRAVGIDTSTTRKLALKYGHLKGEL